MSEAALEERSALPDPATCALEAIDVSDGRIFEQDLWAPYFERLRAESPVHFTEQSAFGPFWSITKFDDIVTVEKDDETYSSARAITIAGDLGKTPVRVRECPGFVVNRVLVKIDATSSAIFGGPGDPLNISSVDLEYGSVLAFLEEDPNEFLNEHLNSVTVQGVPGVPGGNLNIVSDGGNGTIVTVIPQTIGTSYCTANPNSTGVPSVLIGLGSDLVADNDLTIEIEGQD